MGKNTKLGMSISSIVSVCSSKKGLFLSVYVDGVDLGEPTSFLDHVYLGCTQRECKPNETIIDEYRKMLKTRVSVGKGRTGISWRSVKSMLSHCLKMIAFGTNW